MIEVVLLVLAVLAVTAVLIWLRIRGPHEVGVPSRTPTHYRMKLPDSFKLEYRSKR